MNCNIYTAKAYVWVSGLPDSASLDPGTYFFAVLDPGGQRNPNDGSDGNLSDDVDPYTNRTFTIDSNGDLTTAGSHDVAGNRIRVGLSPDWFADTTNPGGVYILAVCELPDPVTDSPGVSAQDCKYDAFKVSENDNTPPSADLGVSKIATPAWARDYDWGVTKEQLTSNTPINASTSTVSVNYRVKATWSVRSNTYSLAGTISVNNPNSYDVTGVGVSDQVLSDATDPVTVDSNATCTVQDGSYTGHTGISHTNGTIPAGVTVDYLYSCTYSGTPTGTETNRATATWDAANALPHTSGVGDASFTWPSSPTSETHTSTTVSDAFNGGAAQALGDANVNGTFTKAAGNTLANWAASYDATTHTFTLTYTRSVTVVANTCTTYNNTATVSADNNTSNNSANASVSVCGRITGGLTIGFWSNNNGRAVLCSAANDPKWRQLLNGTYSTAPYNGGSYLRTASGSGFYTVPGTSCTSADGNFATWLLNATSTNMSYMLSAQLAGTILNVNFNGMNGSACIAGPSGPATINSLIATAITFLRANGNTTASGPLRDQATALKNIFDKLNNGQGFATTGC